MRLDIAAASLFGVGIQQMADPMYKAHEHIAIDCWRESFAVTCREPNDGRQVRGRPVSCEEAFGKTDVASGDEPTQHTPVAHDNRRLRTVLRTSFFNHRA
ncbi:hypothetical protein D3C73_733210 [compost metagenome]